MKKNNATRRGSNLLEYTLVVGFGFLAIYMAFREPIKLAVLNLISARVTACVASNATDEIWRGQCHKSGMDWRRIIIDKL
jgi:hypothetical protein